MNSGGSYIKDKNGNEKLLEQTLSHKKGDRGRDAQGNELRTLKKRPGSDDMSALPVAPEAPTNKQAKKGDK